MSSGLNAVPDSELPILELHELFSQTVDELHVKYTEPNWFRVDMGGGILSVMYSRAIIYSKFYYDLVISINEMIPDPLHKLPIKPEYLITAPFTKALHEEILTKINTDALPSTLKSNHNEFVWEMSDKILDSVANAHLDLDKHLTRFASSFDIIDIIEVTTTDRIRGIKEKMFRRVHAASSDRGIIDAVDEAQIEIMEALNDRTFIPNNPLVMSLRNGTLRLNQVQQMIGVIGYVVNTKGESFPHPITTGYVDGLHTIYSSCTEASTGAISLVLTTTPVQIAEYFARMSQLITMFLTSVWDDGKSNCENPYLLKYDFTNDLDDSFYLHGKHIRIDGRDRKIRKLSNPELMGKTLEVYTITGCNSPDPQMPCRRCIGEATNLIPPNYNVGFVVTTPTTKKFTDGIFGAKGLCLSKAPSPIIMVKGSTEEHCFVRDEDTSKRFLYLSDNVKSTFKIKVDTTKGFCQIPSHYADVKDVPDRDYAKFTDIRKISIMSSDSPDFGKTTWKSSSSHECEFMIGESGFWFSKAFLNELAKSLTLQTSKRLDATIVDWDRSKPIFVVPARADNPSALLSDFREFIKDTSKEHGLSSCPTREDAIAELRDVIGDRCQMTLLQIEPFIRVTMCTDPDNGDFTLPRGGTSAVQFRGLSQVAQRRNAMTAAVFESQLSSLHSPHWGLYNRPDTSVFDSVT